MKKFLSIITACLIVGIMMISCNSNAVKAGASDSTEKDSALIEESNADYSGVSFNSPDEVREFLNFKKFDYAQGYIAFNGKGGVLDSEPFTVTDIKVKNDKTAEISINLPKMNLSGAFTLKVTESGVTLEDEKSNTIYKLR